MTTVYNILPNANGDTNNWSDELPDGAVHYQCVDDPAGTPDDSTTVFSKTVGNTDLYQFENIITNVTVNSVVLKIYYRSHNNGTAYFKPVIKTHGTEYQGSEITTNSSWQWATITYTTNPYTESSWTPAEVNDIQAGMILTGSDAYESANISSIYLAVSTEPAASSDFSGAGLLL